MRDQLPSDFIYQEMFAAFDIDGSGAIEKEDLETSAKSMGWTNQQVNDLINELDPNHDGRITQEEFILILSYIE